MRYLRIFGKAIQFGSGLLRFAEVLRKLIYAPTKSLQQFVAALEVFLERVQSFVIPGRQHLLTCSHHERHVHLDFRCLANSVEPADSLFQDFGIEREIKQDEVMSKLEVPPFTADFRTKQDARSMFIRKPGGVAIPLQQRKPFVKHGGLQVFDSLSKGGIDCGDFGLRTTDQKNFLRVQSLQQTGEPVDSLMLRGIRLQRSEPGHPARETGDGRARVTKAHAAGAVLVE